MSRHFTLFIGLTVSTLSISTMSRLVLLSHSIRLKRVTLTFLLTGSTVIFIRACRIID